jgi:hypothetical protein
LCCYQFSLSFLLTQVHILILSLIVGLRTRFLMGLSSPIFKIMTSKVNVKGQMADYVQSIGSPLEVLCYYDFCLLFYTTEKKL